MRTTSLYRLFDNDDRLLYVGVTYSPHVRILGQHQHAKASPLRGLVARYTLVPFTNRRDALDAERAAIQAEAPLFNKQHNFGRHLGSRVAA